MCFGYKLRLKSSVGICRQIEMHASDISRQVIGINILAKENSRTIQEIKKLRVSLGKLRVQEEKPEIRTKFIRDLYRPDVQKLDSMNSKILEDSASLFREIHSIAGDIDKISFDTASLIYREDKRLSILIERLMQRGKYHKIIFHLNMLKGRIKTIALRLFEASKFERKPVFKYSKSKIAAIEFAQKIKDLSIRVWSIEKAIASDERKEYIDRLVRESRAEIDCLRNLVLDMLGIIPEAEKIILGLENELYLFDEDISAKIKSGVKSAKEELRLAKDSIADRSQQLFEEIELIAESK